MSSQSSDSSRKFVTRFTSVLQLRLRLRLLRVLYRQCGDDISAIEVLRRNDDRTAMNCDTSRQTHVTGRSQTNCKRLNRITHNPARNLAEETEGPNSAEFHIRNIKRAKTTPNVSVRQIVFYAKHISKNSKETPKCCKKIVYRKLMLSLRII